MRGRHVVVVVVLLLAAGSATWSGGGGLAAPDDPPPVDSQPAEVEPEAEPEAEPEPQPGETIELATGPYDCADRGTAVQLTPPPPPPAPDWRAGWVPGCTPGALIRGVDTGGRQMISFTFDDGPWPYNTDAVMDIFEARGLTATFFMIGINLRTYPDIGRQVVERGFAVGSHSITHRYTGVTLANEVGPMNSLIASILGVCTPYYRSPGLTQASCIQSALASAGQCNLFTTVDLGDWRSPRRSAAQLCGTFAATLHPGEIVLLHEGGSHAPTIAALPCMLDVALARGYEIVPLAQLLNSGTPYC